MSKYLKVKKEDMNRLETLLSMYGSLHCDLSEWYIQGILDEGGSIEEDDIGIDIEDLNEELNKEYWRDTFNRIWTKEYQLESEEK